MQKSTILRSAIFSLQVFDALVDRHSFCVGYGWPARDFLKGAQTTPADIVAEHRGAVANARAG